MKTCSKCGEEKPLSEYYKNKSAKDGYRNHCKKCVTEYKKEYYSRPEVKERKKEWQKEYDKKYYSKPEVKERKKEYYSSPEWKEKQKEYQKEYSSKPEVKEQRRCAYLRRTYGITLDEYNEMFVEQNGCCASCGKHESEQKKTLAVDHDHETLEVRGLLCDACNISLGLLQEDEDNILSLLAYIKRYK